MVDSVKPYDADQVTVNFGGLPIESGYADGEFVRIEQQEDSFTVVVGTDGQVSRSKTNNRYTVATILLMQTSEGNAILSAAHNLDLELSNGASIVPLFIRDRQGLSLFTDPNAWIIKPPDVSLDREATSREWPIGCPRPTRFDGGN